MNSNIEIEISEKKNIIHDDPEIYTIDDVLTTEECDHFISISKDKLAQSLVADEIKSGGVLSNGRTSKTAWINHSHDEITKKVADRISNIVNMPLENAENFQIVYYNVTQEYRSHFDSWKHDYSEKTLRYMKKGGARLKTALLYLNNVEDGGETKMTKLNKSIQAKKGKLLVFDNTYKDSHVRHPMSEHAGMPVNKGEKYIFNLWFRECKRNQLYQEFNPEYYEKDPNKQQANTVSLPPPPPCLSNNSIEKKNTIIHKQFYLELGDFFPLTTIPFVTDHKKEIYNYVDDNEFLLLHVKDVSKINSINIYPGFNYIVIFKEGEPKNNLRNISTKDDVLYSLFKENDKINVYLTTPNRKIYKTIEFNNIEEFNKNKIEKSFIQPINIPYLLIENVFSDELLKKVLKYYDDNTHRLTPHYTPSKNRLHVHPDKELEIEIDNKLSRSVFPEIRKIFYFDVHYRESYKICCYNSETGGRFHPHRDTPSPYQHRRYAMSLFLNDDYEGGDFELPEYNFKIKPKANCALVFPGISSHKVNQVTKGARRVIITFFCSELDGKTKGNSNYAVKSHFFEQHNVKYGPIFPK